MPLPLRKGGSEQVGRNPTSYQIKKGIVTADNKMDVKLARSGGFALSLIEATAQDLKQVGEWK